MWKSINVSITKFIIADGRFCSSCRSKIDVRDQSCINCGSKKSSDNEKEIGKATTSTKSLNEYLFKKRNKRNNYKATRKTISDDRRKPMSWGDFKMFDGSVTIEIGIMDATKG